MPTDSIVSIIYNQSVRSGGQNAAVTMSSNQSVRRLRSTLPIGAPSNSSRSLPQASSTVMGRLSNRASSISTRPVRQEPPSIIPRSHSILSQRTRVAVSSTQTSTQVPRRATQAQINSTRSRPQGLSAVTRPLSIQTPSNSSRSVRQAPSIIPRPHSILSQRTRVAESSTQTYTQAPVRVVRPISTLAPSNSIRSRPQEPSIVTRPLSTQASNNSTRSVRSTAHTVNSARPRPNFLVAQASIPRPTVPVQASRPRPIFSTQASRPRPNFSTQASRPRPNFPTQASRPRQESSIQESRLRLPATAQSPNPRPARTPSPVPGPSLDVTTPGMECPVCYEGFKSIRKRGSPLVSTVCGHVFCNRCLSTHMRTDGRCPTCMKETHYDDYHPLYLF